MNSRKFFPIQISCRQYVVYCRFVVSLSQCKLMNDLLFVYMGVPERLLVCVLVRFKHL